jgi:hypothetical protein
MSTNIIAFENMGVAAYDPSMFDLNIAAEEFASAKFPVISTKGGRFTVKREGTKTLITREKVRPTDPDEPASYIDMVVLNLQKSKTFYIEGYSEGSEEKPDCTSADGITPDAGVKAQQCSTCSLCPHNAWGSGVNDKGEATKGKACSDVIRLAVASPANLDDAFMLRVPPASLKNFAEVSKWLTAKRIPVNGAVIRISFDMEKTGVMTFQAIGGLDSATYQKSSSLKNTDLVLSIVGKGGAAHMAALPAQAAQPAIAAQPTGPTAEEVAAKAKAEAKAKKVAAAKAAAEAAAAAAKAAEDDDEDPVAPAAQPAAAPSKPAATPVATSDTFDAELNALLG